MSNIPTKPPVSRLSIVYYSLGAIASLPALMALTALSALTGASGSLLLGVVPFALFIIVGVVIQKLNNASWIARRGVASEAGWSKLALGTYLLGAVAFVAIFYGFADRGAIVDMPGTRFWEIGKALTIPMLFITVGQVAQSALEITFALSERFEGSHA
jgi:hypothetical protein